MPIFQSLVHLALCIGQFFLHIGNSGRQIAEVLHIGIFLVQGDFLCLQIILALRQISYSIFIAILNICSIRCSAHISHEIITSFLDCGKCIFHSLNLAGFFSGKAIALLLQYGEIFLDLVDQIAISLIFVDLIPGRQFTDLLMQCFALGLQFCHCIFSIGQLFQLFLREVRAIRLKVRNFLAHCRDSVLTCRCQINGKVGVGNFLNNLAAFGVQIIQRLLGIAIALLFFAGQDITIVVLFQLINSSCYLLDVCFAVELNIRSIRQGIDLLNNCIYFAVERLHCVLSIRQVLEFSFCEVRLVSIEIVNFLTQVSNCIPTRFCAVDRQLCVLDFCHNSCALVFQLCQLCFGIRVGLQLCNRRHTVTIFALQRLNCLLDFRNFRLASKLDIFCFRKRVDFLNNCIHIILCRLKLSCQGLIVSIVADIILGNTTVVQVINAFFQCIEFCDRVPIRGVQARVGRDILLYFFDLSFNIRNCSLCICQLLIQRRIKRGFQSFQRSLFRCYIFDVALLGKLDVLFLREIVQGFLFCIQTFVQCLNVSLGLGQFLQFRIRKGSFRSSNEIIHFLTNAGDFAAMFLVEINRKGSRRNFLNQVSFRFFNLRMGLLQRFQLRVADRIFCCQIIAFCFQAFSQAFHLGKCIRIIICERCAKGIQLVIERLYFIRQRFQCRVNLLKIGIAILIQVIFCHTQGFQRFQIFFSLCKCIHIISSRLERCHGSVQAADFCINIAQCRFGCIDPSFLSTQLCCSFRVSHFCQRRFSCIHSCFIRVLYRFGDFSYSLFCRIKSSCINCNVAGSTITIGISHNQVTTCRHAVHTIGCSKLITIKGNTLNTFIIRNRKLYRLIVVIRLITQAGCRRDPVSGNGGACNNGRCYSRALVITRVILSYINFVAAKAYACNQII